MRGLIVCAFLTGCAELAEPAHSTNPGACVNAGATRVLAWDIDPEVPIRGSVHDGVMTVVYESDVFGRTALDLDPLDLTIRARRRVDPEPVSGPNGFVRLPDPESPAVAFVAKIHGRDALAAAPIACGQ